MPLTNRPEGEAIPQITRWTAAAVVSVTLAGSIVGCGASRSSSAAGHPGTATRRHVLPSPFEIAARYSARSLGLDAPEALAIGPDGDLYVTDFSQRVTVISPDGTVLRRWGKPGSGPSEFRFTSEDPSDPKATNGKIAVGSNGLVYVSDSGNARVQVFTEQGRFVRQFGSFGTREGQFLYPFDIAVDAGGNVYVADDQNAGVVNKFSPNGRFLWQIGGPGSSDADLAEHHHFDGFDSHGRLVMVGDQNGEVIYLDGAGLEVDSFNASSRAFPDGTCEVTVDALGNTYVTGCHAGPTLVFDRTHRLVAQWPGSGSPLLRSPSFGPNREAFALRADPSGGVYADQLLKLRITLPGG